MRSPAYNGRHFSPEARRAYGEKVEAGEVDDEAPVVGAYSPMGEAILDLVWKYKDSGGIVGKDVINQLRTDDEFNATLTPHNTGAYNIMARLVRRKQINRLEDGACLPGPKFPKRNPKSKWLGGAPLNGHRSGHEVSA